MIEKWVKYKVLFSIVILIAIFAIAYVFDLWHDTKSSPIATWTCILLYFIHSFPYALKSYDDDPF